MSNEAQTVALLMDYTIYFIENSENFESVIGIK